MSRLGRLVEEIQIHQRVSALVRDPDPKPTHNYQCDPQSGAGNCVCGMAQNHRLHPHAFTQSSKSTHCVCALPREAICHQEVNSGVERSPD